VTPRIGIFYLIGEKLLIDSAPLQQDGGDIEFHSLEHEIWWAQLVSKGMAPDIFFYAELPRGRVSYLAW
jgi:hypothetical protein